MTFTPWWTTSSGDNYIANDIQHVLVFLALAAAVGTTAAAAAPDEASLTALTPGGGFGVLWRHLGAREVDEDLLECRLADGVVFQEEALFVGFYCSKQLGQRGGRVWDVVV